MTTTTERDWEKLKTTFCRFTPQQKLGHIATNMARIMTALQEQNRESMARMSIQENMHFIEWFAVESAEALVELSNLRGLLSYWESHWEEVWNEHSKRVEASNQAQQWSDQMLHRSVLSS